MNLSQTLTVSVISGVVSALTVIFVMARLTKFEPKQPPAEIRMVKQVEESRVGLTEQCRLVRRIANPGV